MEKLSVVVPVYNVYSYLRQCLDSIINQTYADLEIIVVNDASPYEEDDIICKEYAEKDKRIIYIKHKENKGLGGARNTGIQAATGKYITFVDSDDYLYNNEIYNKCINIFESNGDLNMVFFNILESKNDTLSELITLVDNKIYGHKIVFNGNIHAVGVCHLVLKMKDIITNKLYFLEHVCFEDIDFLFKYKVLVKPIIYGIQDYGYVYRQRAGSIMNSVKSHLVDHVYIFENMSHYISGEYKENVYGGGSFRSLFLSSLGNLSYILQYMDTLKEEEYITISSGLTKIMKNICITEEEFIKYIGFDGYRLFFQDKYMATLFNETVKKIKNKKYMFIQENILLYKITRELKRVINQIKKIFN